MKLPALVSLFVVLSAGLPTAAQDPGEDQTRDHEREDQRYYERYQKPPEPAAVVDPPAENPGSKREAFLALAERLVKDPNFKAATSEHYRVETDDPRADPRAAADLLESFRSFFETFWSSDLKLQTYDETSRVFMLWSFQKFNQVVTGDWRFSDVRPNGHYRNELDAVTLHTDPDGPPGGQADALVHEAAHQLVNQRIYGRQAEPSRWVSEGVATYFGFTFQDAEGFHAGAIGGKAVSLIKDQRPGRAEEARERLQHLRRTLKDAKAEDRSPFTRVLESQDPGVFYGSEAELNYTASWVLVHYLLHADAGRHRPVFVSLLARDAQAQASPEALYGELGMNATQLHAVLSDYAKHLEVR